MIKNTFFIFCGRIANAIFLLLLTLVVSRLLGPSLFGTYSFIATVVLTGSFFANYGLDTLMVRDVSRNPDFGKTYLANILGLKIFNSLVTILLIIALFALFSIDSDTKKMLLVLSISLIFNTLSQTLWHYGDCFKKFVLHAVLWPLSNFIKTAIGIALLFASKDISFLIWGLVFAELISFIIAFYLIGNKFGTYSFGFKYSVWRELMIKSTPLAFGVIFSVIYFRLDVVMLQLMKTDIIVGWYSAAYKLIEVFTIIPGAIVIVLFPSLSKNYLGDKSLFIDNIKKAMLTLLVSGFVIAMFLSVFSNKIIILIFGKSFLPSVFALQILSWALLFIFINYLLFHILLSAGKEKIATLFLILITLINITLNLILIPKYDHVGAGYSTLISEIILMVMYSFIVWRIVQREKISTSIS